MIDWTDRHCRFFHRRLSRHARLYTEMIVADAVLNGDRERLLGFDPAEHPLALQLGGSDPRKLAAAARIGIGEGYDEINLNVGCPSDRVQSGTFGACLMLEPNRVADCVAAMSAAVAAPVTVKHRLGVDDQDPEDSLFHFVETVAAAGCRVFVVHARKAWLKGLSPKENREIPPLDYEIVARLKASRPDLCIVLNGGVETVDAALAHLRRFDGVMLGRAAYHTPMLLAEVDRRVFGDDCPDPTADAVAAAMDAYVRQASARGVKPHHVARHMAGLYHGAAGARAWRRVLSEGGADADPDVIMRAAAARLEAAPSA